MHNLEIMRKQKIHEVISVVKLLSLFFAGAVVLSIYEKGEEIHIGSRIYELDAIRLNLISVMILVLIYPIWNLLSKGSIDKATMGVRDKVEAGIMFLIPSILIFLSGGHASEYKFLFLFIIIISTLQFGKKYGVTIAFLSSIFLLSVDLLAMSPSKFNRYFQTDLVLSSVFILTAWLLGDYVYAEKDYAQKMLVYFQEREQAERELVETLELDRIKNEFFANISHELKTPVNVIFGTVQLLDLQSRENGATNNKHLGIMRQNCYRLIRLVNNLVDTTKIDSGFLSLHLQNDNIVNVVENITLSVAQYIESKGLTLEFDTEVEERMLACDPEKIERIMLNLLSNAVKFTDIGGRIEVTILDHDDHITISVKDTGIGIAEKDAKMIFERFRQVDRSLARNKEGSGIGLSLVKSLVEMHGGRIYLQSQLGKGSEFIIELPVQTIESEEINPNSLLERNESSIIEKINVEFSDIYF